MHPSGHRATRRPARRRNRLRLPARSPNVAEAVQQRRGRRRAAATAAAVAVVGLAGAWGAGLIVFVNSIPRTVVDEDTRADAIVVLTGGSERLSTGLRLLRDNKADRVFVSGVFPGVEVEALIKLAGAGSSDVAGRVEAGHGARNTAGNATETAAWMRRHGYRKLRLVTGSYHMPRSLLEFRHALPEAVVIPHPVFPSHVKQARWWQEPGTLLLIISEYNKFLWSAFVGGVASVIERATMNGEDAR